ncbi:SDR family NAD(P)-dependent oxidoreductase [Parvularcula sp. IMCC14364]|uniref:SDR family NAD(P)-dependent oxidoreductase n=1 Tax=Parvularcula sp. IMCC14364 TaxID=3067902 RepID=UPI002742561B|nr:SDR family oxidoreductase [Parvularcula sp. IMCC14364]
MSEPKNILITGVCGGIGHKMAEVFAEKGWRVIGTDQREPDFPSDHFSFVQHDLEKIAVEDVALASLVTDVQTLLSGAPLHALVNNGALQVLGGVDDLSANDFLQSFKVNTLAPFRLVQSLLPDLEKAVAGTVLNIGSVHAQSTKQGFVAYATTKTALHGLTRSMAVDLGNRVRICGLAPAATDTPMLKAGFKDNPEALQALAEAHPLRRIASTREVAEIAVFLVSGKAAFIHGETLYADGGVLSRLHDPA